VPDLLFQHIINQQLVEVKRGGRFYKAWMKIGDKDDHYMDALMQATFAGEILGYPKARFSASPPKPQAAGDEIKVVGNIYGRRQ